MTRKTQSITRSIAFLLFALSGFGYVLQPAPSITAVLGDGWAVVWAVFLMVGGLSAALAWRSRLPQWIGLTLIITAYTVLGVVFFVHPLSGFPRPAGFMDIGLAIMFTLQFLQVGELLFGRVSVVQVPPEDTEE